MKNIVLAVIGATINGFLFTVFITDTPLGRIPAAFYLKIPALTSALTLTPTIAPTVSFARNTITTVTCPTSMSRIRESYKKYAHK
ncbi:MAG: hypothetical protein DRN17_04630 [Thermoplasmata archaeon]|nr:MAG: hypothetical protein DRN17_04630 [Thermoplasmata archaeon]